MKTPIPMHFNTLAVPFALLEYVMVANKLFGKHDGYEVYGFKRFFVLVFLSLSK